LEAARPYTGTDNLDVLREAENYNSYLVDALLKACPDPGPTLDFGAGLGLYGELLRKKKISVDCLEPDIYLSNLLKKKQFTVFQDVRKIETARYVFIYSLNVLEHIKNDLDILLAINRKLAPGGILFLYVPAFNILYTSMDKKVGHFRRYRHKSLSSKLVRAGFMVKKWRYVDCLGFLAALLYKISGPRSGNITRNSIRNYDKYIFPLSCKLDAVFHPFFGKNLMIIATKGSR